MTVMNLDKLEVWVRAKDFAETFKQMTTHAESIGRQLNKYIAYLKRSKQGEKEFPKGYSVREEPEPYILDNPYEDSIDSA